MRKAPEIKLIQNETKLHEDEACGWMMATYHADHALGLRGLRHGEHDEIREACPPAKAT